MSSYFSSYFAVFITESPSRRHLDDLKLVSIDFSTYLTDESEQKSAFESKLLPKHHGLSTQLDRGSMRKRSVSRMRSMLLPEEGH